MTKDVVMAEKERPDIVQDEAKTKLSDLWLKEDYWAIWLGFPSSAWYSHFFTQ